MRAQIGDFPQPVKPGLFWAVYGTTEVVPFQNVNDYLCDGLHWRLWQRCFSIIPFSRTGRIYWARSGVLNLSMETGKTLVGVHGLPPLKIQRWETHQFGPLRATRRLNFQPVAKRRGW
jgi:hypothetical protein